MPALTSREIYAHLASQESFPFQGQPWWLDAVCGPEGWDVGIVFDQDGQPIGALPYGKLGWNGLPVVKMPPFTPYLSIWLRDMGSEKQVGQYHWEHKILNELIAQLPRKWVFDQQYAPAFSNGLVFSGKGWRIHTRYTYILDTKLPPDLMWRDMESATRNLIRKAKGIVRISSEGTPAELYELIRISYARKGEKPPFSLEELSRMDDCLRQRNLRTIFKANDEHGNLHAACLVVWDQNSAHGLLNGAHPDFRQSGAVYRLFWTILKESARRGLPFDFEGSMLPQIERVFRSFGARRVPYLRVVRYQNRFFEALAALLGKTG